MGFVGTKNDKLFIGFTFHKERIRLYLKVDDTPKNRKFAEMQLSKVEAEIELENLGLKKADLASIFPNHPKFAPKDEAVQEEDQTKYMTVAEYFPEWLGRKIHITKNSVRTWQSFYRNYIEPCIGDKRLCDIKEDHLLRMLERMRQNLKNSVINKKLQNIESMFRELHEDGIIDSNPFRKIKKLRNEPTDINPFTEDELKTLLKGFKLQHPHYYNFISFLAFTGCRPNEAIGLKWSRIDWENKKILIREGYVLGESTNLKTASSIRDIEMNDALFALLKSQKKISEGKSEHVFINMRGKVINWANFFQKYHEVVDLMGLKKRPPYQLRHTFASMAIKNGEDVMWVSRTLGHSNLKTTLSIYARYIPNKDKKDGSKIGSFHATLRSSK
jgi:integrase